MTRCTLPLALALAALGCKNPEQALCETEPDHPDCTDVAVWPYAITPDVADHRVALEDIVDVVALGDGAVALADASGTVYRVTPDDLAGGETGSLRLEDAGHLASAGDFDGDGVGDLLVWDADSVRVHPGSSLHDARSRADAVATFSGFEGRPILGASGGGDTDGDGVDDIVISEHHIPDSGRGNEEVRIVSGASMPTGSRDLGDFASSYGAVVDGVGDSSMAMIGDFDGDGLADLASGAVRNFAAVHPAAKHGSGPFGGLSSQEVHLHDCHPQEDCPNATMVAAAGDVDGDGLADLLTWATPNEDAWVIPSAALSIKYYATQAFGGKQAEARRIGGATRLVGVGDVDGNGMMDVVAHTSSGAAWLMPGNRIVGDAVELPTEVGASEPEGSIASNVLTGFGEAPLVVGPGDLDGNGLDDLIVVSSEAVYAFFAHPSE